MSLSFASRYVRLSIFKGLFLAILAASLTLPLVSIVSAEPTFLEPSPYLTSENSPFSGLDFEFFHLEDFEDLALNTPGASASTGTIGREPRRFRDSVDGDDGEVDGSGIQGESLFSSTGSAGVTFTFDATVLGNFPTHAGVVWTDAESPRTTSVFLEAFDPAGVSLGISGPHTVGDNTTQGTTFEDRFLGVIDSDGISAIRIFNQSAQMEVDHLQYGRLEAPFAINTAISAIQLGQATSIQLETLGGVAPFTWNLVSGTFPAGMSLSGDGVFSGTPTELESSTFTASAMDSDGDTAEKTFTVEVVFVLPPPDIRIIKVGTIAVPGRTSEYFILVENTGDVTANDIQITELLNLAQFSLVSTSPPAQVFDNPSPGIGSQSLILWEIPALAPGERKVFNYQAKLAATVPFGTKVLGPACRDTDFGKLRSCLLDALGTSALCGLVCTTVCTIASSCIVAPTPACFGTVPSCFACLIRCGVGIVKVNMCREEASKECSTDEKDATGPIDPNEKLVLAEKFIQPDQLLVYPIHYENIGQIEALDVFVTDVLDSNLDLSTVELLTSNGGSVDNATRTVRWELLGRNLQPGETDSVLLAVKPLPNLPSGTEIRNKAEIQFEIFDPLVTNETVNIIDSTAPSCKMDALPVETTTLEFPISWQGEDAIGEIESFSVFVSESGNGFKPLIEGTLETSTMFAGEAGVRYEFLCVAKDTAGNIETQEPTAETATRVNPPAVVSVPDVVGLDQAIAEDLITTAGLTVGDIAEAFSNTVPMGSVIHQDPLSGSDADAGSMVNLLVSKGPELISVPGVVGQNQNAAEMSIVNGGLMVGDISRENSSNIPEGSVIRQTPTAGESVSPGSKVDLVISSGVPSGQEGDFNSDGCVDRSDYAILIADIRDGAPNNSDHDLNQDSVVNRADARTLVGLFTNPRGAPCS